MEQRSPSYGGNAAPSKGGSLELCPLPVRPQPFPAAASAGTAVCVCLDVYGVCLVMSPRVITYVRALFHLSVYCLEVDIGSS